MVDINSLSSKYETRLLDLSHADEVYDLCVGNPQFYDYYKTGPSKDNVVYALTATPPDTDIADKYFIGFYEEETLVAIMDLVDGYPRDDIAYIGFFMMNPSYQGKQIGTAIIDEVVAYLKSIGMSEIRLAIDKENPQSNHFWKKNGFEVLGEVEDDGMTKLVAARTLADTPEPRKKFFKKKLSFHKKEKNPQA